MISKKLPILGINQDDTYTLVDTKEYLNALNLRFTSSENGKVGQMSTIEGNIKKDNNGSFVLPTGTNITVGAYEDTPNRRVIFFNKNSSGADGIYCYDADTSIVLTVLLGSQVVGGLNFSSLIHSVAMVDNLLYWTDGVNQQRRINVDAGIKLNHVSYSTTVAPYVLDQDTNTKMLASVITLIRNQPSYPLSVAKRADTTYLNNLIAGEAFQFAYRFVYRDYEISTFSALSELINYNVSGDTYNAIDITLPLSQKINQDVIRIEVAVRYVLGGKYSVIKNITTGFSTHNSGTAIAFTFYNDNIGIAVDDASANKQFDSIPLKSSTLEIAKNRLFLGNNYDGYESPASTSVAVSTTTGGGTTLTGRWSSLLYRTTSGQSTLYFVDVTGISPNAGYYEPSSAPTPPTYPSTVAFSSLTYRGAGISNLLTYYGISYSDFIRFDSGLGTATITGYSGTVIGLIGKRAFKSDSSYNLGVVFYDEAGRKCGVITNDSAKVVTGDRTYGTVSYTTDINWSLTNSATPSVLQAEIPSWAYYYSVVMTKCLRTNFFVQSRTPDITYIKKDPITGEYITDGTFAQTNYGVGISLNSLTGYGQGYSYQAGDICKLYPTSGSPYVLKVKDTFAEYLIVDLVNLGSLSGTTDVYLFELYTPYLQSFNELYYERGAIYSILNAGLSTRSYSSLVGSFKGDITILERSQSATTYLIESMSPSDLYWQNWNTDAGRANIVLSSKGSSKKTSVYWSNVIIPGTQTNGLSTFNTLDQTNLPIELSSIQKLQLVSKVGAEGTVMLAVGEQETASIYLGEAQIFDNNGNSFLATTSGVIGNVNVLRGSYGTINPESIFRWRGNVILFDANKGAWVRYDSNGLFPISQNKMAKYFRKVGQDVLAHISDPTEFNLSNPGVEFRVLGGIDPYHEEYLSSIPRMTIHPANAVLSDMELETNNYAFATLPPTIDLIPNSLSFSYSSSGPSSAKSCTFIGSRLIENGTISVSGDSDFEISLTGASGTFTSGQLNFPYTGTSANGVFWVRFKSGKSDGTYTSTRQVSGGGASTSLYLEGTKIAASTFSVTPASMSFTYILGAGPSASQAASYSGTVLSADGTFIITGTADFEVSLNSTTGFTSSISMPYTGTSTSGIFYIRLIAGRAVGSYGAQSVTMSNGTRSDTVSCTGSVTASSTPTLSSSPTSLSFTYVEGAGPSVSQSATYSGSALISGGTISISAPSNFQISSDNSTFSSALSISYTGTSPSGSFYVRMISGLTVGSYGPQTITISGGGGSTSISASGSVTSVALPPVLTASPTSLSGFAYEEGSGPSTTQTFTVSGSNLTPASGNVTITPPTHYEISVTSATAGFSSSALTLAYTGSGTFASPTVWVRLKAGFNAGTFNGETISLSGGGSSATVTCNGVITAVDTSITLYFTAFKNDVSSKKEVRWYLSNSPASKTEPVVAHPFYMDLQYYVYGTGIDSGISSPCFISTLELSNIASNTAQGTLATNWVGGIYPLKIRLRTVDGSYGPYTTVKNADNTTGTNPVTFTVGTQAYKIYISIIGFNY